MVVACTLIYNRWHFTTWCNPENQWETQIENQLKQLTLENGTVEISPFSSALKQINKRQISKFDLQVLSIKLYKMNINSVRN